ncbi:MAG TPA: lysophospholipid acyltransferase family protein [Verrucomicrobiae bacterium]|nr:lysophospholipid acyltransferase family protein [Verrucomicrobiae bacterium]
MKTLAILLVYSLVRLLHATYRFQFHGVEHVERARALGRGSYVFAIWHRNLFAGILAQTGTPHTVIVSRSADGDVVAFLCKRLGHLAVRGSSRKQGRDKGGKEAKDQMIDQLKAGSPGAVTVDGPSGPPDVVKPGIIEMARRAEVPVVPYATVPARYWTFNSWDRFRLPKPFSKIDVYYGAPHGVDPATPFEAFGAHQAAIAEALQALERSHRQ